MPKKSLDELFARAMNASKGSTGRTPSPKKKSARVLGAPKSPKKMLKPSKADFDDEDSVKIEMAKALGYEPDDLDIKESHLNSFGTGTFYEVESGQKSWIVARNEEEAHDLAVAVVKQDLENEPEMFERKFIQSHIRLDRLRRDLESDVQNMYEDDLREEAERNPIQFVYDNDLEDEIKPPTDDQIREWTEEEDEISEIKEMEPINQWDAIHEEPEIPDTAIESIAEERTKAVLKDPIAYLSDMGGDEEGIKRAIEIAGIDEDAAADEAVRTDGWEHFLSRYDGKSNETPSGFVYWREN